jgi:hypothetical protein|tara:strand:+ start:198 stop:1109 length:912 start_codon:yes stop_codon:yes gene_type:complete
MKKTICVIGKGHSGTGFLASILDESGVYMGAKTNRDMDKFPYNNIYRIMSLPVGHIHGKKANPWSGKVRESRVLIKNARTFVDKATNECPNVEWDFSKMISWGIPKFVRKEMKDYLKDLDDHREYDAFTDKLVGWKLTESNLIYPWLVRLYPDWYYIHLVRDVRDTMNRPELSDTDSHTDLFNVKGYTSKPNKHKFPRNNLVRALNWKYQLDIVKCIEAPNYMRITLEDLVMSHGETIKKISDFLGVEVNEGRPKKEVVESWKDRDGKPRDNWEEFSFLNDYMEELKYSDWPLFGDNKEYRRK